MPLRATSTATASSPLGCRSACADARRGLAIAKEERFSKFRSEEIARLIWIMGAIAAEQVFYNDTTNGVGGDMQSVTTLACIMAGASAMGPKRIEFEDGQFRTKSEEDEARKKVQARLREIGERLVASVSVGAGLAPVLNARDKRPIVTELLGYSYYIAYNCMKQNKDGVQRVAEKLIERLEMHGDEVVELLDGANLKIATIDYLEESTWPRL